MFRSKSFTLVKERFRYVNLSWVKFLIIPGLAAFTLLLILSNVKHPDYYRKEGSSSNHLSPKTGLLPDLQCTKNMFCVISCVDGDITNFKIQHLPQTGSHKDCDKIDLHLLNMRFPEEKMIKGWLDGNFKINSLQIRKANLREIAPGSFESPVFAQTITVELSYLKLKKLCKKFLSGLHGLKKLILLDLSEDYEVEDNFFEGLLLEELYIQVTSDKKFIKTKSLLGSIKTPSIKIVDLTGNRLGKLAGNDTFDTLTGVETLTLADCHITEIEPGTFDSLPNTLKIMDLRRNSIKSISPEVFKGLIPSPGRQVLLCNNPLSCSNDLCPFIDLYINNKESFEPNLKCFDFGKEIKLENHVLCKDAIQKTDSPNFPVTEVSIEMLEDRKKIHCDENIQNDYLEVAPPDAEFYIETVSSTGVQITLIKTDSEYSILWFHTATRKPEAMETNYNDFGLGCNTRIFENIIIEGMKSNSTYVFCLIKVGSVRISPFNCHSHYLEAPDNDADNEGHFYIWGSKPLTIFLICMGILVSFFIGGCSAYHIISWKPTLVKGSKRVIVVNKSSPNVLVLPRNSNSSFTTHESNQRKIILRRHSDCSVLSGRSYVVPINMYEAVQYQQRKWRSAERIYADKIPKDCPPPLPKRLSNNSTIPAEELYGDHAPTNDCRISRGISEIDLK